MYNFRFDKSVALLGTLTMKCQYKCLTAPNTSTTYMGLRVPANTAVHDFNGHEVNGKHGFSGKKCYDGGFNVVNNGKMDI